MVFLYILILNGNESMWLKSIFGASLSQKTEFFNGKATNFFADQVKSYALTCEREISADNGMLLTYPSHLE